MKDENSLKNLKIDTKKILDLGFYKEKNLYKYENNIMNNQFLLSISIDKNNIIESKVIELDTNEEFILYNVIDTSGEFVGKMRDEYTNIIEKVKNECCSKNVYKSEYSKLVIEYIKEKYNDELEFLWEKSSDSAIWRNKDNNKWYGVLLVVEQRKLGLAEEGTVEIIDLLIKTEELEKIVDNNKYFPGYHMNKKHWITLKLDGSVEIEEIYEFIDNSYNLSKNKK